MPNEELPAWLDNTGLGMIGILTMNDGKQVTAELVDFDEERDEIVIEPIHASQSNAVGTQNRRSISVHEIASFYPQTRTTQPWPYSDPCRNLPFSLARFSLMTALFLSMTAGGLGLFLLWAEKPYGVQAASVIVYTIFEVFFTFAATSKWRRNLFTCPAVQPQIPRLLLRHLAFVVALVVLQTAMLAIHPSLPDWWNVKDNKGRTPFVAAVMFSCIGLGFAQVYSSRALLDRAHREFSP